MSRKSIAILILALWAGGLAWMLRRNFGGDASRRLTEAAIRVQPATYYYAVSYRGEKIGAASSAIDTLVAGLISEDFYTGRFPVGDSLEPVSARLRARLTRGFHLTDILVQFDRGEKRNKMSAFVQSDTTLIVTTGDRPDSIKLHVVGLHAPLLPPTLVGVPLILGDRPKTGLSGRFVVFDPTSASTEALSVTVKAESLFTVVDSATKDPAGKWQPVHSDTVRAWRLASDTRRISVWVDAEGRIVDADAPNGVSLRRTAFELAFDRARRR